MTTHPLAAQSEPVYLVDGSRTPFLKARGEPGPFSAADLAVAAGKALLLRQPFTPEQLDEVILGCVSPAANEANIARIVALRLHCAVTTPAWTVQRNCASGMQALASAAQQIQSGQADLVLAGGTEAMSRYPLLLRDDLVSWLGRWRKQRHWGKRIKLLAQLRMNLLQPIPSIVKGLKDPVVGLSMGQTAELLADRFAISRKAMDELALQSHQRLANAEDAGKLAQEIVPLYGNDGKLYASDDGLRRDSTLEKLAMLSPVFDRPAGLVTAGNSAQVSDGACLLLLASAKAIDQFDLQPLGELVDCQWAGLDPAQMGLGPVYAISKLLQQRQLSVADIDSWEINEAFAAQVLACLAAWQDDDFCRAELGHAAAAEIPLSALNVDGGGISLGHPVGASGARIVLHLLHRLHDQQQTHGIASLCIGGGQGGAMLIKRSDASISGERHANG